MNKNSAVKFCKKYGLDYRKFYRQIYSDLSKTQKDFCVVMDKKLNQLGDYLTKK